MPSRNSKRKFTPKKHLRNLGIIVLATFIDCAGYLIFLKPNDILAGGVWGVAAIIHYFVENIPMGAFVAILNVPLLLWGWNKLNLRFALYTMFVISLQTVLLIILIPYLPTYVDNPLLACIFGGVLCGVGPGLIVKFHGSVGGTDIAGIIFHKKYDISVGSISFAVKVVVVTTAGFIFDFELAMYTMVSLFISAQVFNQVLEGINRKRNMMIISAKGHEIAERLMQEIGRGVTIMKGEGAYSHEDRDVLFYVVSRFELATIKDIVREVDRHAFVCINETYEVMGRFPQNPQTDALKYADALNEGGGGKDQADVSKRKSLLCKLRQRK